MEHRRIYTSAEVYAVIMARHRQQLKVFSTYSAPEGDSSLNRGIMLTEWGFDGEDYPIVGAETTWDIDQERPYLRNNEKHWYWLCIATPEAD